MRRNGGGGEEVVAILESKRLESGKQGSNSKSALATDPDKFYEAHKATLEAPARS